MPGAADFIQKTVHTLEAGALAIWIRRLLVVAVIICIIFAGSRPRTRWIRRKSDAKSRAGTVGKQISSDRAPGQLGTNHKNIQPRIIYDTYELPLPPLADAIALCTVKSHWKMTPAQRRA